MGSSWPSVRKLNLAILATKNGNAQCHSFHLFPEAQPRPQSRWGLGLQGHLSKLTALPPASVWLHAKL